jgi:hypothetical protein
MAWETGDALNHTDLLARLRRFVSGRPTFGSVTKTGTGNGTLTALDGGPTSVTENWVIECITAVVNGGVFSVVGSVSGAQPDATVGVNYVNPLINFRINDGTVDFLVGTKFEVTATVGAMKTSGQAWEVKRSDASTLMLMGKGLAGTDEIYVNMKMFTNPTGDLYNLLIRGAVGYTEANAWNDQAGQCKPVALSLWSNAIKYWFIASGRRFIIVAKVSTSYMASYCGFMLPYATPNQYPYPLVISANIPNRQGGLDLTVGAYNTFNYTNGSVLNSNYWCPCGGTGHNGDALKTDITQTQLYWVDGQWVDFFNRDTTNYPGNLIYHENSILPINLNWLRENLDGSYEIRPHQLCMGSSKNALAGELEGSFYVSGFSNGAENTITIGGSTYLVVPNVFRNGIADFAAIKLE